MEDLFADQTAEASPDKDRAAVDEASFMRYYKIAMKAAAMDGPAPTTEERVIPCPPETSGNVVEVVFGDTPLSRMTVAIKNQMCLEEQMDRFPAVFSRMLALIAMVRRGSLKQWAVSSPTDPQQLLFPDAVVLAAAVAPLDDLAFGVDQFERLVNERVGLAKPRKFVAFAI
jgi:hypothetical protein